MEQQHNIVNGLNDKEVLESRKKYGNNILTQPKKTSLWVLFFEKFKDPIIKILLVALSLSFLVSLYHFIADGKDATVFLEPVGILVAIVLATGVGFVFERSANKKFDVLTKVNDEVAIKVIRNSKVVEIPRYDVVVGDIMVIQAGDEVAADAKLIEATSLQINESTLTGEPVTKKSLKEVDFDKDATYPTNQVFRGTSIVEGYGVAEVLNVGDATEYGKVYKGSQIENNVETPLNKQLHRLSSLITKFSYSVAAILIIWRLVMLFTQIEAPYDWIGIGSAVLNTLMIAITIIVVTVPEGLPMSVTLSLALSMKRMLATNNLVRKMHACETMGACTVICTDKTGTLTQNQMHIYETQFSVLGDSAEKKIQLSDDYYSKVILSSIAINTTAFLDEDENGKITPLGNPTEGALLLWLRSQGERYEKIRAETNIVDQLTFSTERKYMASIAEPKSAAGHRIMYVKGAPEIVLALCNGVIVNGTEETIDANKGQIEEQLALYQSKAMRTLGFAYMEISEDDKKNTWFEDGKLIPNLPLKFLGIVAISDPIRAEVPDAIKNCLEAGIDVKIVTGDTQGTATEIARQIGLWKDGYNNRNHITGPEFAALSDEELLERVMDLKIISRARPMDKERLVKALQAKDMVVAVTGDGTNDAPALNAAQVGLSMGDGTSVAKEASDITILDNSFASINRAVMWGRSLYKNVQRFIVFQMTISLVACLIVLIEAMFGGDTPLTVTQMLWVNLIMDTFAAMALAALPPDMGVMKEKPRKAGAHIISKAMGGAILFTAIIFVVLMFGLTQYFKYEDVTSLSSINFATLCDNFFRFEYVKGGFSYYERSCLFTFFVMLQFWNMFNAKAFMTGKSAFNKISKTLKDFVAITMLILLGQIFIVNFGGEMFSVAPIMAKDWLILIFSTSAVLIVGELYRLCLRLFRR